MQSKVTIPYTVYRSILSLKNNLKVKNSLKGTEHFCLYEHQHFEIKFIPEASLKPGRPELNQYKGIE
jgi:hypothetical protein